MNPKGSPIVWRKLSGRPGTIQVAEGADDHKRRTHQAGAPSATPYFLLLVVLVKIPKTSNASDRFSHAGRAKLREYAQEVHPTAFVRDNKPSYRADARDARGSGAAGAHVSRISGALGIVCVTGALGKVLPARLVGLGF